METKGIRQWLIIKLKAKIPIWEQKYFPKSAPPANPLFLSDLSPKADLVKSKDYCDALNWALRNEDVYNIAITGPYGSGKSSIIKAFEETHQDYKYLKISLASFSDELEPGDRDKDLQEVVLKPVSAAQPKIVESKSGLDAKKNEKAAKSEIDRDKKKQEQHRLIELSILQQIFYKESDELLPESRFKRIKKLEVKKLYKKPLFLLGWIIALFYMSNSAFRENLYSWDAMSLPVEFTLYILFALYFLYGAFLILVEVSKILFAARFSKLNLTGGEIEMDNNLENSILNKHLDEIIYFFEVRPYNVVIIEDLDRFNDPDIFTKLREINLLINNSVQINRHIRFVYAVKDDMFTEGNRTKFFDFILPVLPAVTYSNSIDILLTKFENADLKDALPKKFLYDIALYINDMRLLLNIFNEFMLYHKNLKQKDINKSKLMSMIIYKNIYPSDFALLHNREGIIFDVMNRKEEFTSALSKGKEVAIKDAEEKLDLIRNQHLNSVKELRSAYIQEFLTYATGAPISIEIASADIPIKSLTEEANWSEFKTLTKIGYYYFEYPRQVYNSGTMSFKELEKYTFPKMGYNEREEILNLGKGNRETQAQKELDGLKQELYFLRRSSYKTLFLTNKEAMSFFATAFTEKKLLVYLVRGGYIDEMYEHFMSYFYNKSLQTNDMNFLLSLRNREVLQFDYDLNNIEELLHRLEPEDFIFPELLNYKVVDFLFKNKSKYSPYFKILSEQLCNGSKISIEFMREYLNVAVYFDQYVMELVSHWFSVWKHIITDTTFSEEKKMKVLTAIIKYGTKEQWDKINFDKTLEHFICRSPSFLSFIPEEQFQPKLQEAIEHFKILFESLSDDEVSAPLFDSVYENNNYKLNEHMVSLMSRAKGKKVITDEQLKTANLTSVYDSGADELGIYINEEIKDYVEDVLLALPRNTKENQEIVIALLNIESLEPEQRKRIIVKQEALITFITEVPEQFWPTLLENEKIVVNWDNLSLYFDVTKTLDRILIDFFNKPEHFNELRKTKMDRIYNIRPEDLLLLQLAILREPEISDKSFEALSDSFFHKIDNQAIFTEALEIRTNQLIESGVIPLSVFNFENLKQSYPLAHIRLIEKNIGAFLKNHEQYILEAIDYIALFDSKIAEKDKLKLAELVPEIGLSNKLLAEAVLSRLNRKRYLKRSYPKIVAILSHNLNFIERLKLLSLHIQDFSREENAELLNLVGDKFAQINDPDKKPMLDDNPLNKIILDKLETKGLLKKTLPVRGFLQVYHK